MSSGMRLCVAGLVTPDTAKKRGALTLNVRKAQSLKCESNTLFRNITQRHSIAPQNTQLLNKPDGEFQLKFLSDPGFRGITMSYGSSSPLCLYKL